MFAQFLECDLNVAGAGCLPDVEVRAALRSSRLLTSCRSFHLLRPLRHQSLDGTQLNGRYVLQLDEAIDTSVPSREQCV